MAEIGAPCQHCGTSVSEFPFASGPQLVELRQADDGKAALAVHESWRCATAAKIRNLTAEVERLRAVEQAASAAVGSVMDPPLRRALRVALGGHDA